ncbi:hypothetical protein ABS768_06840 [Flavobacterium sp. ST-75]|uniref:Uncharacterized protein n=1 Tax=Flavobacterium rhizophilum TaxID=3163296 RepID=A0ABW8YB99_9FLAO
MDKISEAEINSCTRKFLLDNDFQFISTKNNGEKFYYRINNTFPPLYKQPDCLSIKDNVVIVWEEKIKFKDLFRKQATKISDIEKISNLTLQSDWKNDFISQICDTLSFSPEIILLMGGVNSLKDTQSTPKHVIPNSIIQLETTITLNSANIKLVKCPDNIKNLFPFTKCSHIL